MSYKNQSFYRRFLFAIDGVRQAFKRESSLKIQVLCAFGVTVFSLMVRPPVIWCALFGLACVLVIALEMVNTAIEVLADVLHPQHSTEIGFVKDCLAGAVLVASLGAVLIFTLFLYFYLNGGI